MWPHSAEIQCAFKAKLYGLGRQNTAKRGTLNHRRIILVEQGPLWTPQSRHVDHQRHWRNTNMRLALVQFTIQSQSLHLLQPDQPDLANLGGFFSDDQPTLVLKASGI
jgi:hypothetical protein